MVNLSYFLDRIRDVKLKDYLAVFSKTLALMIKPFFRSKYEGDWLICEEPTEAKDNGYYFFKYMRGK